MNDKKKPIGSLNNLINSSIATIFAELITIPICTVKTQYQNSDSTSIINIIKKIYKENGIKIFFKSSGFSIFFQVVSTSSKFVIYRYLNTLNFNYVNSNFGNKIIDGAISGILSSILTHPIEFAKINTQMKQSVTDKIKNQGIKIIYKGYSKTIIKATIGSSLFFPFYDFFNTTINNPFYASFCSATLSTLILHPIDYIKTRNIFGLKWFNGFNPFVYYKGLSLSLARVVPHFMITMIVVDYLEKKSISTILHKLYS